MAFGFGCAFAAGDEAAPAGALAVADGAATRCTGSDPADPLAGRLLVLCGTAGVKAPDVGRGTVGTNVPSSGE
ncbi:MAG TPA: hypothetical protein VE462_04640 [Propionibacteriaceae bacterium]|nr:hypothetical protein [Propionibacteriaceae bacterium]